MPSGYPARTRLPGWPGTARFGWGALDAWYEEDEQVFVHPRNLYVRAGALRSHRYLRASLDGVTLAESTAPCWFSEQACRRTTTLIALASCSSILCIATRGPLARTRAARVIAGRCGCTVGGTSAAARWTAQPPQRCTPSPGPCPVLRPAITGVMPAFRTWAHEELARSWDKLSGWTGPSITKWRLPAWRPTR
jgi:hypothetical protein